MEVVDDRTGDTPESLNVVGLVGNIGASSAARALEVSVGRKSFSPLESVSVTDVIDDLRDTIEPDC